MTTASPTPPTEGLTVERIPDDVLKRAIHAIDFCRTEHTASESGRRRALKDIEILRAHIGAHLDQWISVSERLPDAGRNDFNDTTQVMVYATEPLDEWLEKDIDIHSYVTGVDIVSAYFLHNGLYRQNITHWRALPAIPAPPSAPSPGEGEK